MSRLAPYLEQHKSVDGPGDARPTALQVVQDQDVAGKWTGRVALVTGCSPGGLGLETARAMHATGADVYITVRDVAKGAQVAEDILSDGQPGKVEVIALDLSSLDSVRACAATFRKKSDRLNVLINNAGIMCCPELKTKDGFELQFGTNHLGHFLLFQLLKETLLASSTPDFNSRVIVVSSSAHRAGEIYFDDLNYERRDYDPYQAYAQSKLANIHFANELDRRYGSRGLHALSLHPGGIDTELSRHSQVIRERVRRPEFQRLLKSQEQGAATTVWAAVAAEWEGRGGKYLDDVSESEEVQENIPLAGGYVKAAFDPPTEKRLWVESLQMVGLPDDS